MTARPLRILALTPEDITEGCAFARLATPLQALSAAHSITYAFHSISPTRVAGFGQLMRDLPQWDIVWVQRPHHYTALLLIRAARRLGKPVLVDIDDWILDLPPEHPAASLVTSSCRETIRLAIQSATALTVSTPVIAERCAALGARAHIVPNAVDCAQFTREPRREDVVTIGYCGSISHREDVSVVVPALREVLHSHAGRVAVVSVGCPLRGLEGVAGYTHHAPVGATDYPRLLSRLALNVGLAPLQDNAFTRAKSDIKYLEYAATGALTIASLVAPYSGSVRGDRGVVVAADTPESWHDAIRRAIDEPGRRDELATNAYQWVRRERSIQAAATRWETLFYRYAEGTLSHSSAPPIPHAETRRFVRVLANLALHEAPHDAAQVRRVLGRRMHRSGDAHPS